MQIIRKTAWKTKSKDRDSIYSICPHRCWPILIQVMSCFLTSMHDLKQWLKFVNALKKKTCEIWNKRKKENHKKISSEKYKPFCSGFSLILLKCILAYSYVTASWLKWRPGTQVHQNREKTPPTKQNILIVVSVKSLMMKIITKQSFYHATTHSVLIVLLNYQRSKTTQVPFHAPTAVTIHNSRRME